MRSALLVEHDPVACSEISTLLKSLGYIVATTDNPRAALNTAQTVRFDLVLTYTTFNADDRRSFIGEITRLLPQAPVILLLDEQSQAPHYHARLSTVLTKPVTLRSLRRVIEFGIDGNGAMPSQATHASSQRERRRQGQRRMQPR
ncbi:MULTISPECIES: response regulator [unclassified Massilia]|uniref:response regulator n=1 Tax=unclassified Massilia TaxID=2609279 RepID=UPI000A584ACF|nr:MULTISPECIES: response regulator [unclassified Massilia]